MLGDFLYKKEGIDQIVDDSARGGSGDSYHKQYGWSDGSQADKDWMEEANATYKTGIRFQDFLEKGKSWSYPFGGSDKRKDIRSWPYLRKKFPSSSF